MKRLAIITPGIMPVPTKIGGAVEQLITCILIQNEDNPVYEIDLYTVCDVKEKKEPVSFSHTNIRYVERKGLQVFLDRLIDKAVRIFRIKGSFRFLDYLFLREYKKYREQTYDLILVENMMSLYKVIHKNTSGSRMYFHIHNDVDAYRSPGMCRYMEKHRGSLIAVSEYIACSVMRYAPYIKSHILYNCIDTNRFRVMDSQERKELRSRLGIREHEIVYLFCGRMIEEKGILQLLNSFTGLSKAYDDVRLLVVGSYNFYNKKTNGFGKMIEEKLAGNKKILYYGLADYDKMPEVYNIADVVVIPSIGEEPFGMVALEAMALKKPVIAAKSGGLTEVVSNNCAIMLDKLDSGKMFEDSLLQACISMRDTELRITYGNAAYIHLMSHPEFLYQNYYNNLLHIFDCDQGK